MIHQPIKSLTESRKPSKRVPKAHKEGPLREMSGGESTTTSGEPCPK